MAEMCIISITGQHRADPINLISKRLDMNRNLRKALTALRKIQATVDFDLDTMTEIKKPIVVKDQGDHLTITTEDPENHMLLNYHNEYGYLSETDGVHPDILKILDQADCTWEWMWADALAIYPK